MATINAVKLCNINIDGGDKLIPYNTFSFKGLQSLFILENGGGKTTFIHLLLQVVLPNTSSGKRSLDETLEQGKNGFIIVEWKLDDKGDQRLITGFSFENRKEAGSGKSSLRFYTYTIEYPRGKYSINDLPVYTEENGRKYVTSYEIFRDKVKNITKVPTTVYNSKKVKEYQAVLREQGVIPEEWENIKKINVSEGAADAFFEKTDTVPKLLHRLFIPSLEKAMFSEDKNGTTLTDAFYKFQENLLKIPDIQKNIKDFAVVEDNVEEVIQSVEKYESEKKEKNEKKDYLLKLSERFNHSIQAAKESILLKQRELSELNKEATDLDWKIESFESFKKKAEIINVKKDLVNLKEELELLKTSKDEANRTMRELKAIRAYNRQAELLIKRKSLLSSIENLEKKDVELKGLVDQRYEEASYSWIIREKELKNKIEKVNNEVLSLSDELKNQESKKDKLSDEAKKLTDKKARIEVRVEELQKSKELLLSWFDEWELLNPQECIEKSQEELEALLERKKRYSNEINNGHEKIGNLKDELNDRKLQKINTKNSIEAAENKLGDYYIHKDKLSSWLSSFGSRVPSNQNELDEVLMSLRNELADKESELEKYSNQVRVIEEDLLRLKETPYFVPNNQIEGVKRYLDKRNIFVVLGSEWLSDQDLSETEKTEILNKLPLLPYSVLVESSQIKDIPKEMNRVEWKSSSPIIFIDKEELLRVQETGNYIENLNLVTPHENTWVYQSIDVNLFVGKDKIKELIERNEELLIRAQIVVKEVKGKHSNCRKAIEVTEDFFSSYSFEYEVSAVNVLNQLKEKRFALKEAIESKVVSHDTLSYNIEQWNEELEVVETKLKDAEDKQRKVKEFVDKSADEPMHSRQLKEIVVRDSAIEKEQRDIKVRMQKISDRITELEKQESCLVMEKQQHNDDQKKFGWKGKIIYGPSIDYQLAKVLYESSRDDLNREYKELKGLQDSLEDCNKGIEREEDDIKENEIEYFWLESNKHNVTYDEIAKARELERSYKDKIEPLEQRKNDVNGELNKLEGALENNLKSIKDKYDKEAYRYTDDSEYHKFVFLQGELEDKRGVLVKEIGTFETKEIAYDKSYEVLKSNLPEIVPGIVAPLETFDCKVEQLISFTNQQISEFNKLLTGLKSAEDLVKSKFTNFKGLLEGTDNSKIKQLSKQFDLLLAEERLFDSNYVIDKFTRVLEASNIYKEQLEQTKVEVEKDREELIEMALNRVGAIYDRIIEMPKSSRLSIYGRELQAIRLRWDRMLDGDAKNHMSRHIEDVVGDINRRLNEGASQEEIQRYIQAQLDTRELMKCYAPFHQCQIEIYKPKKEQVMRDKNKRIEYAPWEIAVKWSGGEQYTVYMTMFMVYIMHVRRAEAGRDREPFTIIVDNPFGKASNDHVVDPILETAKKNNIQLICLTAHDTPRIISKFPVVYSNVYNYEPNTKTEILESTFKETLETFKYINEEEIVEQGSLV
ncbi:hypothetical protein [Cytobacillus sp. IB215316]|uniref:hypothetical protein n=1 Tax=Cytobacillus sp. IB215316 TaxID=3097354 RepID=UPI002A0AF735|nr:hypothetical protein [Cytobacillus sp. IB215316]MDX8362903.1 hypothetical protein [Cytobacillus sp. IB215316]